MDGLERVRAICTGLPEVEERPSHGEPSWFVRGKKLFATGSDHHHDDRAAIWTAAPAGVQEHLAGSEPTRYFRPPYVGHRGWVGVYLDVPVDWPRVEDLLVDAYCLVAPKALRDAVRPPED